VNKDSNVIMRKYVTGLKLLKYQLMCDKCHGSQIIEISINV
jgi:cytochrome c peroxidase